MGSGSDPYLCLLGAVLLQVSDFSTSTFVAEQPSLFNLILQMRGTVAHSLAIGWLVMPLTAMAGQHQPTGPHQPNPK